MTVTLIKHHRARRRHRYELVFGGARRYYDRSLLRTLSVLRDTVTVARASGTAVSLVRVGF